MVLIQRRVLRAAFFLAQTGHAFKSKKPVFYIESATVTAQGTAGGDDSMAGDDDSDGVVVIGLAYGPERSRAARLPGDLGIGASFAVGDRQQGVPTFFLEFGADEI